MRVPSQSQSRRLALARYAHVINGSSKAADAIKLILQQQKRRAIVQVEVLRVLGELLGDERNGLLGGGRRLAFHRVLPAEEVVPRRVDPLFVLY